MEPWEQMARILADQERRIAILEEQYREILRNQRAILQRQREITRGG